MLCRMSIRVLPALAVQGPGISDVATQPLQAPAAELATQPLQAPGAGTATQPPQAPGAGP